MKRARPHQHFRTIITNKGRKRILVNYGVSKIPKSYKMKHKGWVNRLIFAKKRDNREEGWTDIEGKRVAPNKDEKIKEGRFWVPTKEEIAQNIKKGKTRHILKEVRKEIGAKKELSEAEKEKEEVEKEKRKLLNQSNITEEEKKFLGEKIKEEAQKVRELREAENEAFINLASKKDKTSEEQKILTDIVDSKLRRVNELEAKRSKISHSIRGKMKKGTDLRPQLLQSDARKELENLKTQIKKVKIAPTIIKFKPKPEKEIKYLDKYLPAQYDEYMEQKKIAEETIKRVKEKQRTPSLRTILPKTKVEILDSSMAKNEKERKKMDINEKIILGFTEAKNPRDTKKRTFKPRTFRGINAKAEELGGYSPYMISGTKNIRVNTKLSTKPNKSRLAHLIKITQKNEKKKTT